MEMRKIPGGVTAAKGFRASGVHAGVNRHESQFAEIISRINIQLHLGTAEPFLPGIKGTDGEILLMIPDVVQAVLPL